MKPCFRCGQPRTKGKARVQKIGKIPLCEKCILALLCDAAGRLDELRWFLNDKGGE